MGFRRFVDTRIAQAGAKLVWPAEREPGTYVDTVKQPFLLCIARCCVSKPHQAEQEAPKAPSTKAQRQSGPEPSKLTSRREGPAGARSLRISGVRLGLGKEA